jgi:hypothetical protein
MTIEVDQADYDFPQIHVTMEGKAYRVALLGEGLIGDTPIAPPSVRSKVEAWFDLLVPTAGRSVGALVYDQWLRARNRRPADRVPPPEEILSMDRLPKRPIFTGDFYAIDSIAVVPTFNLRISFHNGDVRVADVMAMRGHSPLWEQVFANFDAAENGVHYVAWPVLFPEGPNTLEIESQDLWGAGILIDSESRP